jgi:3-methyladenine DNA glycosylase/8-oxoguanine DNA glycosylase
MPKAKRRAKSLGDARTFRDGYAHIRKSDPMLAPILDARGVLKFKPEGEPFESLVESILSQQLAGSAASAIIRKVRALFPDGSSTRRRSIAWTRRSSGPRVSRRRSCPT